MKYSIALKLLLCDRIIYLFLRFFTSAEKRTVLFLPRSNTSQLNLDIEILKSHPRTIMELSKEVENPVNIYIYSLSNLI